MRTPAFLFSLFVFAFLLACDPPPGQPANVETQEVALEAKAPPSYLASYVIYKQFGQIQIVGSTWVTSEAWRDSPASAPHPPTLFLEDLTLELGAQGLLDGLDLGQTQKNWVVCLWPGERPKSDKWILDTRNAAQPPTKEAVAEPAPPGTK